MNKDKIISIRISSDMDEFLQVFKQKARLGSRSELIRRILEYFFIGFVLGEFKGTSLSKMKEKMELTFRRKIKKAKPRDLIELLT